MQSKATSSTNPTQPNPTQPNQRFQRVGVCTGGTVGEVLARELSISGMAKVQPCPFQFFMNPQLAFVVRSFL